MLRILRLYLLEIWVVFIGLIVVVGSYAVFGLLLNFGKDSLAYVSVAGAGMLFITGHVYSRLKDRRDGKRKRAQDLFLEWHSKEIRESRIYVSRWLLVHGKDMLPSLGSVEKEAASAYVASYLKAPDGDGQMAAKLHPIVDPEQKEFHFFKIYQFFERWAILLRNSDIDQHAANGYMSTYRAWYLENFIIPWSKSEEDRYIKDQLLEIIQRVSSRRTRTARYYRYLQFLLIVLVTAFPSPVS